METIEKLLDQPRAFRRNQAGIDPAGKAVVYWMQKSQRADDNPALDLAIDAANLLDKPVVVFLGIVPFYPRGNLRHYRFLVDNLPELAERLRERRVGFVLRRYPDHSLFRFLDEVSPCLVVGDENPLRETEAWRQKVAAALRVRLVTVDADVVVPSRLIPREHPGAFTIRPRIHALLPSFLVPSPRPLANRHFRAPAGLARLDPRDDLLERFPVENSVQPVARRGGRRAAEAALAQFLDEHLHGYSRSRNRPELDSTSRLSAFLHFGQIGPREVALAVRAAHVPAADRQAFLEQLIVRRELAVNFVRYNPSYDRLAGTPDWARRSLKEHARDPRPFVLDEKRAEGGDTPDPLWNAAQRQMLEQGFMHNYLRMYWAKKILEWSPSAERAFELAVEWNDRYQLDGRDPNGYAGIAWAIGGKHDRPWPERAVFGVVRSMTYQSTSKKFDSRRYIETMLHEDKQQKLL